MTIEELNKLIKKSGKTARQICNEANISEQHLSMVRSGKRKLGRETALLILSVLKRS